ncbi:AAA family ATPase [Paraliomyxa miuraensis]|uniref:AAA family ATPase n=1 Tax=Paraliomyxa miuraensis TaxID=376150 RepID=UPI002252B4A5|nr:AAA family ATPase [Paraliomyxa miuraensis]MCX4240754.1 AAA family ATPase [Paraliomyxa miuraensis]
MSPPQTMDRGTQPVEGTVEEVVEGTAEAALGLPRDPTWAVEWDALVARHPWLEAMRGCPQDPVFHAEGDVLVHTGMVCEAMASLSGFRRGDPRRRLRLWAAALLHDVAKPRCTVVEDDGRVRSPGHSPGGALDARVILWRLGVPPPVREAICGLIRFHQVPYHWASRSDSQRLVIRMSQTTVLRELVWLAEADLRGRVCPDRDERIEDARLLAEYAAELHCLDAPWAFANDHARVEYFRRPDRDPTWAAHDDTRFGVTVMSGLPGSGKSTWVAEHASDGPVIELDAIRRELGVSPRDDQGQVIDLARSRARELLRRAQPFCWDATNLGRTLRKSVVGLCLDYGARVRLVHVEAPASELGARNRNRADPVPEGVLGRMLRRWEPPDPTEAHEVLLVPNP